MTAAYIIGGVVWTISVLVMLCLVVTLTSRWEVRCGRCGYGKRMFTRQAAGRTADRHGVACGPVTLRKRRPFESPRWTA